MVGLFPYNWVIIPRYDMKNLSCHMESVKNRPAEKQQEEGKRLLGAVTL